MLINISEKLVEFNVLANGLVVVVQLLNYTSI